MGLALCVLAIGTGEYVVAGVLPAVAASVDVGVPLAGQLVTVYAATVVLAGPALTALTARRPPKGLLLALMAVFVVGTLGCALAGSFTILVAARVVAALGHCTVFAVALVTATSLVPPERAARAIGAVAAGLTLATVLGVPVGTAVGAQVGWRWTFVVVAALGAGGAVLAAVTLPRRAGPEPTPMGVQLRVLARPALAGSFAVTILGYAGVFTAFTYLAPLVEIEAGAGPRTVTAVVTAFGVGGVIGNAVAARSSDTRMRATLLGALGLLAVTLLVLPLTLGSVPLLIATVGLFGAAAFATVPGLQARVIGLAAGAPTLAAATNVAAFNLANTVGAALGGVVAAGAGLWWTAPAGGVVTLGGLLLAAGVLRRSSPSTRASAPDGSVTGRDA